MKRLHYFCICIFGFIACANVGSNVPKSYIGVNIPDFKNGKVDSLVLLYETDRNAFYKAQEANDLQSYYTSKLGNGYNPSGFYDEALKILNADSDQNEITKFQNYISESSLKVKAFRKKLDELK